MAAGHNKRICCVIERRPPTIHITRKAYIRQIEALGEKAQIGKLVYYFRYPASDWDRYHTGHALNWVVGKVIYVGSFPGGTPKDPDGNEREIDEFQSWWDANKGNLTYDRVQGYTITK